MAEAAREMTPEELFDKAMGAPPDVAVTDVTEARRRRGPMLSLMADERAHRRADAKLDRLIGMVKCEATEASEFRERNGPDEYDMHRGVVYLLGVITGGLGVLVLRLLGV